MGTTPLLIEYEGPFDMGELYQGAFSYLEKLNYKVDEDQYKNKTNELEIAWTGKRNVDPYVRFVISVSFHFWGIKPVEVTIDGKKEKKTYARFKIEISGEIITGYEDSLKSGDWKNSLFVRKLRDFFNKRILNKDLIILEDQLFYETVDVQTHIKKILNMESSESAY
jgi:hypothetical protein